MSLIDSLPESVTEFILGMISLLCIVCIACVAFHTSAKDNNADDSDF